MISAGEVRLVSKQQVAALVEKIQEGVKPDKARKELGFDWAQFTEGMRLAALELQRMTPEGRSIASGMWKNYIPVDLREGTHVMTEKEKAKEAEAKAVEFFNSRSAARARFEIPDHPEIKYVSANRLRDEEWALLEAGTRGENSPLCAHSPYIDHDNLRKGATYYFAREDAEQFRPDQKQADRLFASKKYVITVFGAGTPEAGRLKVRDADVNHEEANILRGSGYVLVWFEGEKYWMSRYGADRTKAERVVFTEEAVEFFKNEVERKFEVPDHPEIKYIPDNRLKDKERARLMLAIGSGDANEDVPFVPYTPYSDYLGLKKGSTYWFTAEDAAKLGLTNPKLEAMRLFSSKKPVGDVNRMVIPNRDLTNSEARVLSDGGYAAVKASQSIGLGSKGYIIKAGEICWVAKNQVRKLADVTADELTRREKERLDEKSVALSK